MKIILGDTRSSSNLKILEQNGWGRMMVERHIALYEGEPWGFDNGAYGWWVRGQQFDEDQYILRLESALAMGIPYMAICPDIVAAGKQSLEFSLKWIDELPGQYPWYLAVQDGMEFEDVAPIAGKFSGIFLGGSDKFKTKAQSWCDFAHEIGLPFHYGRAGTLRKLEHAFRVGSDSCDSAFPLWTRERMKLFAWRWEGLGLQKEIDYANDGIS